jgi:type I restriction enzyme M protein
VPKRRPEISEKDWQRAGYGEDAIRQRWAEWVNQVIEAEHHPYGRCDAQVKVDIFGKQYYDDVVLWKKGRVGKEAACVIELKIPAGHTPLDLDLVESASDKASKSNLVADFFATSNINSLALWKTFEKATIWERRKAVYDIATVRRPTDIDRPEFERAVKAFASRFLTDLDKFERSAPELPTLPIDEFFITLLRSVVDSHSDSLASAIEARSERDKPFRRGLGDWFVSQGWVAPSTPEDFDRVARQLLYLLLNKVLFYNTLTKVYRVDIPRIELTATTGAQLKTELQALFDKAIEVSGDYETIFASNFLETIPIPDEIVLRLRTQLLGFTRYDFGKLEYRDIGRIFDRLIPDEERHKLGQYFTRADVVDIINAICIARPSDRVADFGCGAGTFLVRAYARLKQLRPSATHQALLKQLYGVDISKFPALLSTINLAARKLEFVQNHPQVLRQDFFDTFPNEPPQAGAQSHLGSRREAVPADFEIPLLEAVVGNPPYTRREELEDFIEDYKEKLDAAIKKDWGEDLRVGGKASIHAWFFLHGLRFLAAKGRLGFVTSDSWLDVEYGSYLQHAFLSRTRLLAVISSAIERWFPDAAVNTAITVLEREDDPRKRDANAVKFVTLKVPLEQLISPTADESRRAKQVDALLQRIQTSDSVYEDAELRVFPVRQSELLQTGGGASDYQGSAWGKYLRVSKNLYRILNKISSRMVPLGSLAGVELGYTTGLNSFFYLDEDRIRRFGIEREFLRSILKSPKNCKSIVVSRTDSPLKALIISADRGKLKGTKTLRYVEAGEKDGIPQRPFFKPKSGEWFRIPERKAPPILHPNLFGERHAVFWNAPRLQIDKKLIGITPHDSRIGPALCAYLNSTLAALLRELNGRDSLGYGALDLSTRDLPRLPVLDVSRLPTGAKNRLESWLEGAKDWDVSGLVDELGAPTPAQFNPKAVRKERVTLDKIVFDALGLDDDDRHEVYRATLDLVVARFTRARSVGKRGGRKARDADRLASAAISHVDTSDLRDFPDDYLNGAEYEIREMPESPEATVGRDLVSGFFVSVNRQKFPCSDEAEAHYIAYAVMNGHRLVKVAKDPAKRCGMVESYQPKFRRVIEDLENEIKAAVPDLRLRAEVLQLARRALFRPLSAADEPEEEVEE